MPPRWVFLYPGALLATAGGVASMLVIFTNIRIGTVVFAHHSLILAAAITNIGVQSVLFWGFARIVGAQTGLFYPDPLSDEFRRDFTLERGLAIGLTLVVCGLGAAIYGSIYRYHLSFGEITAAWILSRHPPDDGRGILRFG